MLSYNSAPGNVIDCDLALSQHLKSLLPGLLLPANVGKTKNVVSMSKDGIFGITKAEILAEALFSYG